MKKLMTLVTLSFLLTLTACSGGEEYVTISTASSGGTYYPIGVGLGNIWSEEVENLDATGQSSAGSVENIDLLRNEETEVAILHGHIRAQAIDGSGNFEEEPYEELRSISMLWSNVEHFVLSDDKVDEGTISDIKGSSFSIGPQASGTEESTLTIMEGVGLTEKDIDTEHLGYDDTVSAMRDGQLDGGSVPAGVPVAAVMDMYASGYDATILEVTEDQLDDINDIYDTWIPYEIPGRTYENVDEDVQTIAMPNFLGVSADLDEELVYEITKATYENIDEVQDIHDSAEDVSLDTALDGLPAPLHIGAYKYFEEEGLDIPDELVPPEAE